MKRDTGGGYLESPGRSYEKGDKGLFKGKCYDYNFSKNEPLAFKVMGSPFLVISKQR